MTEVLHGLSETGYRANARRLDESEQPQHLVGARIGGAMMVTILASVLAAIVCGLLAAILGADLFSILVCYLFGGIAGLLSTALMLCR